MTDLSLHDYLAQMRQDILDGKTVSLAKLEVYSEWKKFKEKQPEVALAAALDPEILLQLVQNPEILLAEITVEGSKSASLPSNPESVLRQSYPTEIVSHAQEEAYLILEQERLNIAASIQKRRDITKKFFEKYQKRLFEWSPAATEETKQEIEKDVKKAREEATLKTFEEIRNEAIQLQRKHSKEENAQQAVAIINEYETAMAAPEIQQVRTLGRVVLQNPDIRRADVAFRAIKAGSTEKEAASYTRTYEVVEQGNVNSFGAPPEEIIKQVLPNVPIEKARAGFMLSLEEALSKPEELVDALTKRLGKELIDKGLVDQLILDGNQGIAQYKVTSGSGLFSDLLSSARPASEDMQDYLAAMYERARIRVAKAENAAREYSGSLKVSTTSEAFSFSPDFVEFYIAKARNAHPHHFHFEPGESPFSWILQWVFGKAAKSGAAKTAISIGGRGVGGAALSKLGLPGIVLSFGSQIFSFVSGLVMGGVNRVAGGFGGWMQDATGARPAQDPLSANGWIFPAIIVVIPILLIMHTTSNWEKVKRFAGQPIHDAGGGVGSGGTTGGEIVGPIEYTGPEPAGALRCTNYNVAQRQFCEGSDCVTGRPFTAAQATTINSVLENKQIGLYNCLLQCPQNNVSFYSGGSSDWWGWAAATRSVVLYDGFFASGDTHAQARALAHELAHTYMQLQPNLELAFEQEGYCGKLCTYPAGKLLSASDCATNGETTRETFAESAAMYVVGENLQSLCPKGYDFIDRMFRSCNP